MTPNPERRLARAALEARYAGRREYDEAYDRALEIINTPTREELDEELRQRIAYDCCYPAAS